MFGVSRADRPSFETGHGRNAFGYHCSSGVFIYVAVVVSNQENVTDTHASYARCVIKAMLAPNACA